MGKCKKYFKRGLAVALAATMVASVPVTSYGDEEPQDSKDLVIYFANWDVYNSDYGTVSNIPWDKVTYINHAFWEIEPVDGAYTIQSTDVWADLGEDPATGQVVEEQKAKSHFTAYETYSEMYPDVNVMISVGGWTRCGYFSEMASTSEGRASFIQSCIDTMDTYTWVDGIDIDWEYPGVARDPESDTDEGCPVVGDDYNNYTLLLKEMREAFDAKYGEGVKKLTTCSSVNLKTVAKQDVEAIAQYVDLINVMSYDMTGSYDPVTGHQTALYSTNDSMHSVDKGVSYFLENGVDASKINIGSPLYCHSWGGVTADENGNVVGVSATGTQTTDSTVWSKVKAIELKAVPVGELGWHTGYDEAAQAAYLWNDNPNSQYYGEYLSYENEQSLAAKLNYIDEKGLAGMIVWECGGDAAWDGHPMLTQMSIGLGIYSGEQTVYGSAGMIPEIEDTVSDSGYPDPILEVTVGDGSNVYPKNSYIYYNGAVYKSINDNSNDYVDNLPDGKWGASCWEKAFDVKTYVSQEEKGYWDWAADEGDYVFYDPDKDNVGGIYYATAQTSNTANDAPDGIWGTNWKYVTTVKVGDAAKESSMQDPVNEVTAGTGSNTYSKGTYIFYKDAVYKSINDNSNDYVDNLPDGKWGASCWEKAFDVKTYVSQEEKGYWDWAADEGDYVFYDPDKDGKGGIYYAKAQTSNTANDAPDGIWGTNWEYVTTIVKLPTSSEEETTSSEETTSAEQTTSQQTTTKIAIKAPTVKKAIKKRAGAKVLKITLKTKVKKVKGYQVKVYATRKNALANKKALATKLTKKNLKKITLSGKKLAGKKKVFVKVRAYVLRGGKKVFGGWSKVKKSTVK